MKQAGKKVLMMGNEAIARGLIENGCSMATAYPGTPSSEILTAVAKTGKQLDPRMHIQWAVNEKVAFEIAYAGCQRLVAGQHTGLELKAFARWPLDQLPPIETPANQGA